VLLWPYNEIMPSGTTTHFLLHVVYPKQKTLITMDSAKGERSDNARKVILCVIAAALELESTNDWTDYLVDTPQQKSKQPRLSMARKC
jgi:hypothetical protein